VRAGLPIVRMLVMLMTVLLRGCVTMFVLHGSCGCPCSADRPCGVFDRCEFTGVSRRRARMAAAALGRSSWAPMVLRVAGLVLLYWLASEPTASRTSTVRLIARPMTAAGLASIEAGTPGIESYGDPDGEGEVPPEDDFVPVSPPAAVSTEPRGAPDQLPYGCVEAATQLLALASVSARPWLALPSRCHPGGDWHGQCGPSLPQPLAQGRRACVPPTCASCGVDEAPPDPDAETDADSLPLTPHPVSAASAALAAAAASARANDRNCCHLGGSWHGRCGTDAGVASGAAEYTWKEGYRVCHGLPLTPPPPERAHAGRPFVQLRVMPDAAAGEPGLAPAAAVGRRFREGRAGVGGGVGGEGAGGGGGERGGDGLGVGGLIAYVITLEARPHSPQLPPPLRDKLSRLSIALGGAPCHALPAVPAAQALAAVGAHSPSAALRMFGKQATDPEFRAALGCALSHLHAARRARRDGASPALILEEDATLELRRAWTVSVAELAGRAPEGWTAIQVEGGGACSSPRDGCGDTGGRT
jgi:hypothetical protein